MLYNSYIPERHALARLHPDAIWDAVEPNTKDKIEHWLVRNRIAIIARLHGNEPSGYFRLGISLPPANGKQRLSLIVSHKGIAELNSALYLSEVIPTSPNHWRLPMTNLLTRAQSLDIEPRVFGSFLWQAVTGYDYVRPESDLDLIWKPDSIDQIDKLIVMLSDWEVETGLRTDGEIVMPDGAGVCLREMASTANYVLVKAHNSVNLCAKQDVLAAFVKVGQTGND